MNYQRIMHRIMLESYTLPSRRSSSGIFIQHHSTKMPENTRGFWAHKNEQPNHSYVFTETAGHCSSGRCDPCQGTNNQPFDECDHGCPSVFCGTGTWSCPCRFWILISFAVLLLTLTLLDVHADCEQSLIFLCKATPRVNHAREWQFP